MLPRDTGIRPDASQLRGLSYAKAKLCGMPHLGASYAGGGIERTRLGDGALCALCGRPATNAHHEPPRSNGAFLLPTKWGMFVLKPALIALCGSGTTGCHGARHDRRVAFEWRWADADAEALWWSGYLLSHGYPPHSRRLLDLGGWYAGSGDEWTRIDGR